MLREMLAIILWNVKEGKKLILRPPVHTINVSAHYEISSNVEI
jgi:hypothetical protein